MTLAPVPALLATPDAAPLVATRHVVLLEVTRDPGRRPATATVPGAHLIDFNSLVGPPGPGLGDTPLPTAAQVEALVAATGITTDSTVVVASHDHLTSATRVRWVLRWSGLKDVRILTAAPSEWPAEAALAAPQASATPAAVTLGALPTVNADEAADHAVHGRLIDVRPASAWAGAEVDAPGTRPTGHVPGARSFPLTELLDDDRLAPLPHLRARLAPAFEPTHSPVHPQTLVVQCGSGVAATATLLALELLDPDTTAALYPGSWSGWTSEPGRPVQKSVTTPI